MAGEREAMLKALNLCIENAPAENQELLKDAIEAYAKKYHHSFSKLISNTNLAADLMETMFGA
jgi:hypothetical protein